MREEIDIAVFAYNEQRSIVRCLDSILAAKPCSMKMRVLVLANGCTDHTMKIVRLYAQEHQEVVPVELSMGDKCNAWNLFVHELASEDANVHFFMDGDCWCSENALIAMHQALNADEKAVAIAGLPMCGRSRDTLQRYVKEWHWIYGGLYGVSADRVKWFREQDIRLPVGLCGNDHVITRLLWLEPGDTSKQDWERVTYCEGAGFYYDSLRPYSLSDFNLYRRRIVTYRLRQMQVAILGENPVDKLRPTMDGINRQILAELEQQRLWHPIDRSVRNKLRAMYPSADDEFHNKRLRNAAPPVLPASVLRDRAVTAQRD